MSSLFGLESYRYTAALVAEAQRKLQASLEGQTASAALTWGCVLMPLVLPLDEDINFPVNPLAGLPLSRFEVVLRL